MKTVTVKEKQFKCGYCGKVSKYEDEVREEERKHKKVEILNIGDDLIYSTLVKSYDWGHEYEIQEERRGKIVKKNIKEMKVLVERKGGTRNWIYAWRENW